MGGMKDLQLAEEAKYYAAVDIAVDAGALKRCPHHDYVYEGSADVSAACKLGNWKMSRGEIGGFDNSRDMTDHVKQVIDEHPNDMCPACEDQKYKD